MSGRSCKDLCEKSVISPLLAPVFYPPTSRSFDGAETETAVYILRKIKLSFSTRTNGMAASTLGALAFRQSQTKPTVAAPASSLPFHPVP